MNRSLLPGLELMVGLSWFVLHRGYLPEYSRLSLAYDESTNVKAIDFHCVVLMMHPEWLQTKQVHRSVRWCVSVGYPKCLPQTQASPSRTSLLHTHSFVVQLVLDN